MTNAASTTFDAHAAQYDALRRRLVPSYDRFYGSAVDALGLATRPIERVLDLGAGTGLMSAHVLDAHPAATLTLLDGSAAMLERARTLLGEAIDAVRVGDLADPLPHGPFDAVVSGLAIHHLDDAGKASLYARAHDALAPGGVFVNAEQIAGATDAVDAIQVRWHEAAARAAGATDREWEDARERMRHDRCAPLEPQLRWLRDAGFADVDCVFRDGRMAVLVGRRP